MLIMRAGARRVGIGSGNRERAACLITSLSCRNWRKTVRPFADRMPESREFTNAVWPRAQSPGEGVHYDILTLRKQRDAVAGPRRRSGDPKLELRLHSMG